MDKRKCSRVDFRIDATVRYNGITFCGEVKNISLSGMFVEVKDVLDLNTVVDVTINLTGVNPPISVNVSATVARSDENGIGLKFGNIDLDDFVHLKNIVIYNDGDQEKILEEYFKRDEE